MVAHLADSLKMAPWPKGTPTAPELIERSPGDWSADVSELSDLVDRVAAAAPGMKWPEHPAFGRMTPRAWGVLTYRHVDHHFRQ